MPGQRKKAPASPLLFACLLPARALLPSVIFWKLWLVIGNDLRRGCGEGV